MMKKIMKMQSIYSSTVESQNPIKYKFLNLLEVKQNMPEYHKDVLLCWNRGGLQKGEKKLWNTIPMCIWWTMWKERNKRYFVGKKEKMCTLKRGCLALLAYLCKTENVLSSR